MKTTFACTAALACLSAASPASADIVIGPRFSYYFDNSNLRTSDLEGLQDARSIVNEELTRDLNEADEFADFFVSQQNNGSARNADQVGFPMVGGMVNFGGDRDRFTFTAMAGSSDTTTELVSSRLTSLEVGDVRINELSVIQTVSDDQIDRIDLELTWQRRMSENFAILAGARYERLLIEGTGLITIQETDEVRTIVAEVLGVDAPGRNLDGARRPQTIATERTLETFSGRAGVTAFVPFNDNAVAFFNGMIQGSYQPSSDFRTQFFGVNNELVRDERRRNSSEFSIGPDFAVGAQFIIIENLALDLRYRALLYFPLSGDFDFGDTRVNHGVNLGLSLRL